MGKILEFQTVQSSAIRTLVEVLKDVLNDINITFDETGVKIMAMDGSHVALIHMKLLAERFEYYYCPNVHHIGVCMGSLFKLIKTVNNSDTLSFYIEEEHMDEMCIKVENADKNSSTTFRLKLLDIDNEELNIPDVEINCVVTMPSHDFQRMCRDMMNLADNVTIQSSEEGLRFICKGDFASQDTLVGEANHGLVFSKREEQEVITGTFALKYINLFTKSTNLSNSIELYLKTDYPLILKYSVANLGEIRFCLAPKVD
jgi:proliferating cell nuclear antigen